jgi:P-type E1-E2 ATPase
LLVGSGLLAFAFRRPVDGTMIVAVVVLNALIDTFRELRAARVIEALDALVPDFATVLRDGFVASVDAAELALGDVVLLLQSGDRVAADMRFAFVHTLCAMEEALTGESVPAAKGSAPLAGEVPLAEPADMLFASTIVGQRRRPS